MKLPNAERAVFEREKIADYLLNPAHPDNGGKAAFFLALGYKRDDWPSLAAALRRLAVATEAAKSMETAHGIKYIPDGGMETSGGKTRGVRTIWIVDRGLDRPRLVTAYPCEE
jgi:hypothetical protein